AAGRRTVCGKMTLFEFRCGTTARRVPVATDDLLMANTQRSLLVDAGFRHLTRLFAFFVFILLAGILASLVYGSRDSLAEYGLPFLWTNDWDPVRHSYGALVPVLGTVISAFLAL